MSEEQRREVEKAREQARLSAEKFEKVFEATEPRVPQAPRGRPPETIPHMAIPAEKLERIREPRKKEPGIQGTRIRTTRTVFKERRAGLPSVNLSKGVTVFRGKRKILESSGRISPALKPERASRLAHLREQVQGWRNRKELRKIEQVWAKTRAQMSSEERM